MHTDTATTTGGDSIYVLVWHVLGDAGFVETSNRVWWEAVPPPAIVGIDTLAERLQTELTRGRATLLPPAIVGTWARMSASSASS